MKKIIGILAGTLMALFLSSCTVNITIAQNKDGGVDVKLDAGAGEAFTKMILAATGGTAEDFFDTQEISYELAKSGFSKVDVETKNGTDINVNLCDSSKSSYLFTSGILSEEKNVLKANLNAKALKAFYDSADEQTQMVLDLLVAPVFSDEELSQEEYLEVIESFYGQGAAKELGTSMMNITLVSLDGTKVTKRIPLVEFVTATGEIKF